MKQLSLILIVLLSFKLYAGQASLISLDTDFKGEQIINKTIYISKKERKQYIMKINAKGRILDNVTGDLLDTRRLPHGAIMFVYSKEGDILISKKRIFLKFDHSSLVAGDDVIVAGLMKVNRGVIDTVCDSSPMYIAPNKNNLKAFIYKLKTLGVDTHKLRAFFISNY